MISIAFTIEPVTTEAQLGQVRELFVEWEKYLSIDLGFQAFESELAGLPGDYQPLKGALLLAATPEGQGAGCVAMRYFEDGICEMKRLFVKTEFRGHGLGGKLSQAIVDAGRDAGYARMRLDTLARLSESVELYRSMGFVEIEPYRFNPHDDAVYLEINLG